MTSTSILYRDSIEKVGFGNNTLEFTIPTDKFDLETIH